jgi:hypothetical protein
VMELLEVQRVTPRIASARSLSVSTPANGEL